MADNDHSTPVPAEDDRQVYKVAMVAPTCRYYQVPLFQKLASHRRIDQTVYFCSPEALNSEDVQKQFFTSESWGVEEGLISGYKSKFLRNYSPYPSYLKAGFGLINLGIWREIKRNKPDAVVLMAWVNPTWIIAVLACLVYGVPFFYLTDANVHAEVLKPKWKLFIKRLFLGKLLFKLASGFLCSGEANKQLYRYYWVPDSKLVSFAYSWGHDPLFEVAEELKSERNRIKHELGISEKCNVILFCGRLHEEKRPFHLLDAFRGANVPNTDLVFVGDGELRETLEAYKAEQKIESVHFAGFQNRKEIAKYYAIADLLVLPSYRESWGIVINEAMCFGLPTIVSDQVGAREDLVFPGYNGYCFPEGDVKALAGTIRSFFELPMEERRIMGDRSLELIKDWANRDLGGALVEYLDLNPGKR